jgi:hypothetical protein
MESVYHNFAPGYFWVGRAYRIGDILSGKESHWLRRGNRQRIGKRINPDRGRRTADRGVDSGRWTIDRVIVQPRLSDLWGDTVNEGEGIFVKKFVDGVA